jgi:8-oxo-dGTP pyrophosphatase MutT (NUDIX family)
MDMSVPRGSRAAARVLLLSDQDRLLLLRAHDSLGGHSWWVAPGGGLQPGESFETAAQRELYEETGLFLPIGPWVWTRRHVFTWEGRRHDQYERYFVVHAEERPVRPARADRYVVGHRWWSLGEIEQSTEDFAPRRLADLLRAILCGEYPVAAIDCGV